MKLWITKWNFKTAETDIKGFYKHNIEFHYPKKKIKIIEPKCTSGQIIEYETFQRLYVQKNDLKKKKKII